MPTAESPTLAVADLDTIKSVQLQHSAEAGLPRRHTHTMSGAPLPPDREIWTRHACDYEPVAWDAKGEPTLYAHPLPSKPLPVEVAAKVVAKTVAEVAVAKLVSPLT